MKKSPLPHRHTDTPSPRLTRRNALTLPRTDAPTGPALPCAVTPARRLAVSSLLFAFVLTGCQLLTYTSPTGERFTRSSLGANTSIQSLAIEASTNGLLRRVELRGYQNDSSQAMGAVTEAAVRAAIQGAKP